MFKNWSPLVKIRNIWFVEKHQLHRRKCAVSLTWVKHLREHMIICAKEYYPRGWPIFKLNPEDRLLFLQTLSDVFSNFALGASCSLHMQQVGLCFQCWVGVFSRGSRSLDSFAAHLSQDSFVKKVNVINGFMSRHMSWLYFAFFYRWKNTRSETWSPYICWHHAWKSFKPRTGVFYLPSLFITTTLYFLSTT